VTVHTEYVVLVLVKSNVLVTSTYAHFRVKAVVAGYGNPGCPYWYDPDGYDPGTDDVGYCVCGYGGVDGGGYPGWVGAGSGG
jgi:hypothetical protein